MPQLRQMKPTGILINIGRGAIVDLADLVSALQYQVIAGAALDVFEVEPLPADHPLWRMENVILTPHTAGYSPVSQAKLHGESSICPAFLTSSPVVECAGRGR